jgi:hypothetical protein
MGISHSPNNKKLNYNLLLLFPELKHGSKLYFGVPGKNWC